MATYYTRLKRQILSRVYLKRTLLALFIVFIVLISLLVLKPAWDLSQVRLNATAGRTNILLLGVGGGDHEGGDLTDAIGLVSISQTPPDLAIISIPRDVWIASLRTKINSVYHYGEEKQVGGGGFVLAKSAVSEVVGLPIHYAVLLDFSGFEKIVDYLGGVDVNVEKSFEDHEYPITGKENDPCITCRYETIAFTFGRTHMDGATALKFVRSRHAEGDEGTDYARSKRQDLVVVAIREKILKNPLKIWGLYQEITNYVKADIPTSLYPAFVKTGMSIYQTKPKSVQITDLLENPDIQERYDYQWVLVSKSGSWQSIHTHIKDLLTVGNGK